MPLPMCLPMCSRLELTIHWLTLALGKHGYHDIHDIVIMSQEDIMALTYEDDQGKEIDLLRLHQFPIKILQ